MQSTEELPCGVTARGGPLPEGTDPSRMACDVGGTDPAEPRVSTDGMPRRASGGGIAPNGGSPATTKMGVKCATRHPDVIC